METDKKKSGCTKIFLIFCFSFLAIIGIICIFNDNEPQNTEVVNKKINTNKKIQIVYDISSLYGLNIDQIRKKIGLPPESKMVYAGEKEHEKQQLEPTKLQLEFNKDWENVYEKDGSPYYLDINFNVKSRKINNFLISDNKNRLITDNNEDLLKAYNIDPKSSNYLIEPVKYMETDTITGILITPISNVQK